MVTASLVAAVGWGPSVLILILLLGLAFILLAIVCDEALAPTLEELSDAWKIPHDVACATFLAAGSSAPEIAISLMSVTHGGKNSVDVSLGTLMGSALIAFTIIPAACVLVSPGQKLKLDLVPLARDVTFFCFGLLWLIISARDSVIDLMESMVLVAMFVVYLFAMKLLTPFYEHEETSHHFLTQDVNGGSKYGAVDEEEPRENGNKFENDDNEGAVPSTLGLYMRTLVPPFNFHEEQIKSQYSWIMFISIFYISVLSELILFFAEALSDLVGVNHHLTGLVVIALGAQVPDTVASMAVAKHGEGPSSIANAIGSQVLNINIGIGLPFLLSNIVRGSPVVLATSSDSGHLIFGCVLFFLALVLVERVTLKVRDAVLLCSAYFAVILFFGVYAQDSLSTHGHTSSTVGPSN